MKKLVPPKLERFAPAKQRRLDQLLEKNSEGTLTCKEKARLEQLVAEAEQLMVANAKRLAKFAERASGRVPTPRVPVTIWVRPERAER